MIKVLIDTDILIDYSKGFFKGLNELKEQQTQGKILLFLNPIIIAEYLADRNLVNKKKYTEALGFLNYFKVIDINKKMGVISGEIMRIQPSLKWKDAMIAACCLTEDCLLATRNRKHFNKIRGLKFI